jgi:hypothetical protein
VTAVRTTKAVRAAALAVLFAAVLFSGTACTTATAGRGVAIDALPTNASTSITPTSSADPTTTAPPTTKPAPTSTTAPPTTKPAPTTKPPKKPVSHSCPGTHAATKASSPRKAILLKSPDKVPTNVKASGSQPLTVLVHETYKGVSGAAAFLTKVHYHGGYQLTWTKGTAGKPGRVTEFTTVYQFAGTADACSFAAWESKNFGLKSAKDLPGLTTKTGHLASVEAYTTEYAVAKGRFVILSGALVYGPKSGQAISLRIMQLQYARV